MHQSFDFLPPLTPVMTSSPRRKSGYLNPPIFGDCVRHAAPSTGIPNAISPLLAKFYTLRKMDTHRRESARLRNLPRPRINK